MPHTLDIENPLDISGQSSQTMLMFLTTAAYVTEKKLEEKNDPS